MTRTNPEDLLWSAADTAMGRLIRRFDWSATPLGPREGWSEGLTGLVDIMLGSASPMALACEDDLTILFNDAWRGLLRGAETALGRPARDVEAPPWPELAPALGPTLAGSGRTEIAAGSSRPGFRLSPVFAGAGQPAAVMVCATAAAPEPLQRLSFSLGSAGLAMWDWDLTTDRMQWSPALCRLHGRKPGAAITPDAWLSQLHAEDRPRIEAAVHAARETATAFQDTWRIERPDGAVRWCAGGFESFPGFDGLPVRMLGSAVDVTEHRTALDRQKALFDELQHRRRNMLAVVRSIARRTADTSPDVEHFATHLEGRIDAMARVQTLLMRTPEGRLDLEMLLREELRAAIAEESEIEIEGPAIGLAPKAGETLSLMFSELATNALKFGALTRDGGRLLVRWTVEPGPQVAELHLEWRETGLWLIEPPGPPGFGMELLTRTLPYDLGARTSVEFAREGFRCRVILPLTPHVQR